MRAVVFDWGGTLSTSAPIDYPAAWRAAARRLRPTGADDLASALHDAELAWWAAATAEGTVSGTTEGIAAAVLADRTHDVSDLRAALDAYHSACRTGVTHRPSARPTLAALRARGLRTGLLSNTHWPARVHDAWLAEDSLLDLLDVRVYTCDLAHLKPRPEAFAAVLDRLGVSADEAVFIGDRPYDDIWGAQQAGMRTVLLRDQPVPPYDVVPDATICDLAELPALLDAWA